MRIPALLSLILLAGCGTTKPPADAPINNQTNGWATDAQLASQWSQAQHTVGVSGTFVDEFTPANWIVAPRALGTEPHGLTVRCEPDSPAGSNSFPFNGRQVHGYADLDNNTIVTACSGVGQIAGEDTGDAAYEMQNIILCKDLGYSCERR